MTDPNLLRRLSTVAQELADVTTALVGETESPPSEKKKKDTPEAEDFGLRRRRRKKKERKPREEDLGYDTRIIVPEIPAPNKLDFIVEGTAYEAQGELARKLPDELRTGTTGHPIGHCFRLMMQYYPDRLCRIGIKGPASGRVAIAGGYSRWDEAGLFYLMPDGEKWGDVNVALVGLTDDATVTAVSLEEDGYGFAEHVALYDLGIKGPKDTFIIRQQCYVDTLVVDGCWWLPYTAGHKHTSGMHLGEGWGILLWRNHKFKGTLLREHLTYPKGGGLTVFYACNLLGGNRTGFQYRPHVAAPHTTPRPSGPILIERCYAESPGWEHENPDGGGLITLWANPDFPTVVKDCRITDARYGCLTVAYQPEEVGNYVNRGGYPHAVIALVDNHFENSRGDRSCASVSACEEVHLHGRNEFQAAPGRYDFVIDAEWSAGHGAPPNGQVFFHGEEAAPLGKKVGTYIPAIGKTVDLSDEQLREMIVRT